MKKGEMLQTNEETETASVGLYRPALVKQFIQGVDKAS